MGPIATDRKATDTRSAWLYPAIGALVVGLIHLFTLVRIAHRSGPVAMFYDDFFYYAAAARSYLQLGFTTFDGYTHTNGYHPAWLVLLVQIMRLSGSHFLYVTAFVVCALIAISTFLLIRLLQLFSACTGSSVLCALITMAFLIPVLGRGMESALVAPVLLAFCLFAQSRSFTAARDWFLLGLLGALMVLSRIDAVIFLLVFYAAAALSRESSLKTAPHLLAIAAGSLPAALYFIYNRVVFGAFMTVSSKAKELRTTHTPTLLPLQGAMHSSLALLYLTSLLGLIMYFVSGRGRIRRPLALAALLFPFVQLAALCLLSEWPLEVWYSYGLIVSFPVAVYILLRPVASPLQSLVGMPALLGLAIGLVFVAGLQTVRGRAIRHDSMGAAAAHLAAWTGTHPGRIAMGDRAGKFGWLRNPGPLQLEGIMADVPFLSHIDQQDDLRSVLRAYGIRYYITFNLPPHDGCYDALEPGRGGATVRKMHGKFCSPPVYTYIDAPGPGEIPDVKGPGVVTMVFDADRD